MYVGKAPPQIRRCDAAAVAVSHMPTLVLFFAAKPASGSIAYAATATETSIRGHGNVYQMYFELHGFRLAATPPRRKHWGIIGRIHFELRELSTPTKTRPNTTKPSRTYGPVPYRCRGYTFRQHGCNVIPSVPFFFFFQIPCQ